MRTNSLLLALTILGACSTELIPGAERVRQITPIMTTSCKFLGPVTGSENMGADQAGDMESAFNKIRNTVTQRGGNAFVLTATSTSGYITVVQADAYFCR